MLGRVVRRRDDCLLDLDRAAGGDDRRREQRRDVARAGRAERRRGATGASRATGRDGAASCCRTAARSARRRLPNPSALADTASGPSAGIERRELVAHAAQLGAEARGSRRSRACGVARAPFGRTPRSWATISSSRICEHAVSRASTALREAHPRAHEQRLHAPAPRPERGGEIGVALPPSSRISSAERCCSGSRWTSAISGAATRAARPRRSGHGPAPQICSSTSGAGGGRPAKLVDAAVVGDPVEPRPQRQLAIVRRAGPSTRGRTCPGSRPRRPGWSRAASGACTRTAAPGSDRGLRGMPLRGRLGTVRPAARRSADAAAAPRSRADVRAIPAGAWRAEAST